LDTFGDNLFNNIFTDIYLMDWQNLDGKLTVTNYRKPADYFPGDCRYFKNPDVDPLTPEWQGENTIDLGNNYYYGHGLGISTSDEIIHALNTHRKEGSDTSADLLGSCTLPDFNHLFALYSNKEQNISN
jgi:protein-glutamine gamma-glutamyltransferase